MDREEQREALRRIFHAALKAVDPYSLVLSAGDIVLERVGRGAYETVTALGLGKAACPMARALEEIVKINHGALVTKYGHCPAESRPGEIQVFEAGHPVPDENGLEATGRMMELLEAAGRKTLVVCLVSGGGSALLVSPSEGLTLEDKRRITDLLLKSGADIEEMNAVRKHLSGIKGGRLAERASPAGVLSLIISDVPGDRLDVIASGPTAPDASTYREALRVLEKYSLTGRAPAAVLEILTKGAAGLLPETPKEGDVIFQGVENVIMGSNRTALLAALDKAADLGFEAEILPVTVCGEASEAGRRLASTALRIKGLKAPGETRLLLSGGETTVTIRGPGKGGRNMELALAFAVEASGADGLCLLSAGTDGIDGPTDAAGAFADGETVAQARKIGLDPESFLRDNDSYHFFEKTGGLFFTGPTGTNVMDLQLVILDE